MHTLDGSEVACTLLQVALDSTTITAFRKRVEVALMQGEAGNKLKVADDEHKLVVMFMVVEAKLEEVAA